ncbi:MAG: hypothetical protein WC523_00535 [Patescibacteria group bacterium]
MANFNKDLDFTEFSTNIIKDIDGIRSSSRAGSEESTESRINAFYRAIGLPAIITNEKTPPLNKNNGNVFKDIDDSTLSIQLINRENISKSMSKKMNSNNPKVLNAFKFNTSTIKDHINGNAQTLQLFPMIVDANLEIFPQGRRIGGAFMTDTQLQDDSSNSTTKYKRPLIEMIIYLRLSQAGAFNSTKKAKIMEDMYSDFQQQSEDIEFSLYQALGNIIVEMSSVKNRIDKITKETSSIVIPSGTPEQNPEIFNNGENEGDLDNQDIKQKQYLAIKEARLSLFNFDDVLSEADKASRNLKECILSSCLLQAVFSDAGLISKSTKNTTDKKIRLENEIKQTFRNLDLLLGTFSGLSGTDAVSVILALFQVDIETVISLLNKEGRIRLKKQTGIDYVNSIDEANILNSIGALQTQTQKIINNLAIDIDKSSRHKTNRTMQKN